MITLTATADFYDRGSGSFTLRTRDGTGSSLAMVIDLEGPWCLIAGGVTHTVVGGYRVILKVGSTTVVDRFPIVSMGRIAKPN